MNRINERLIFLKLFLENPKEIGSITPSSRFLLDAMVSKIDFETAKCIVEYGPGTGSITRILLNKSRKDCNIVVFEKNKKLADYLKKRFSDRRLVVVNSNAESSQKYLERFKIKADYVVCSIPLALLDKKQKIKILAAAKNILNDEGLYVSYLYLFSLNALKESKAYMKNLNCDFIFLNLPPAIVLSSKNIL